MRFKDDLKQIRWQHISFKYLFVEWEDIKIKRLFKHKLKIKQTNEVNSKNWLEGTLRDIEN